MKIEFDREADALYIQFQPGKSKKSIKIQEGIILDLSPEGKILGLEILDASQNIPLSEIGRIDLKLPIQKAA